MHCVLPGRGRPTAQTGLVADTEGRRLASELLVRSVTCPSVLSRRKLRRSSPLAPKSPTRPLALPSQRYATTHIYRPLQKHIARFDDAWTHGHVCRHLYRRVCGMCVSMRVDMCIVYAHTCRHVYRHVCRHVCGHVYGCVHGCADRHVHRHVCVQRCIGMRIGMHIVMHIGMR